MRRCPPFSSAGGGRRERGEADRRPTGAEEAAVAQGVCRALKSMAGRHTRWPDGGDPASRPGGPAKKPRREAGRGWLEWRGKGGGAGTLRLLCFNVLAQSLLHKHSFLYNEGGKSGSKSWWLNWKARLKLIRSLLSAQAPDVVLLQEVDGAPVSTTPERERHPVRCRRHLLTTAPSRRWRRSSSRGTGAFSTRGRGALTVAGSCGESRGSSWCGRQS